MSVKTVDDSLLNGYIEQRYHWKTVPPDVVYSMAVELSKLRYVNAQKDKFIGDLLASETVDTQLRLRKG